jgi:hypothetical protein
MLFYNSQTRAGATGRVNENGTFKNLNTLPAGAFGSWTHVAGDLNGLALFYNSQTGAGATGRIQENGTFQTLQVLPDGAFGSWSHVVPTHRLPG